MHVYIIKSLIYSAVFTAYYWLLLRNKKMHHFNRFYLLAAIIISLLLPFCNIDLSTNSRVIPFSAQTSLHSIHLDVLLLNKQNDVLKISFYSMWCIVTTTFLILLVRRIQAIHHIKLHNRSIKLDGCNLIETKLKNAPFTYFENLFWRTDISLNEEIGLKIFKHEMAHIRGKHSIDKMFCQCIISFFWMNPFFWLIQKELYIVHEYIADSEAIEEEDTNSFAQMLLRSTEYESLLNPTHFFYNSHIKRRLFMITTLSKVKHSIYRKLMVYPIIGLISVVLICLGCNKNMDESPSVSIVSHDVNHQTDLVYDSLYSHVISITKSGKFLSASNVKIKFVKSLNESMQERNSRYLLLDSLNTNVISFKPDGSEITQRVILRLPNALH